MEHNHSGLGIASFITSTISGICLFLLFATAGVMESSTPGGLDEGSPTAILIGLGMFTCLLIELVAFGLGMGGLLQKNRNKVFAIIGALFSAFFFLGTVCLILIGLTIE